MITAKKVVRQTQALMVIQQSSQGISIMKACELVGISRNVFYYLCRKNPELIESFRQIQLEAGMRELAILFENQIQVLENLISDALADKTKPRQRLAIYKFIVKRVDDLMDVVYKNAGSDDEVEELLKGPCLVKEHSRFSASENTIPIHWNTVVTSGS